MDRNSLRFRLLSASILVAIFGSSIACEAWGFSSKMPRMDLVLATPRRPSSPDPRVTSDSLNRALATWTQDTLFELTYLDEFPKIQNLLAAERATFESNKRILTIRLKKDLTFSNGEKIQARNFVAAWESLQDLPEKTPAQNWFLSRLQSFEARDAQTLVLRLKAPDPDFEMILTLPFTAPVALGESQPAKAPPVETFFSSSGATLPGSGPFILEEWRPGFGLTLKARPEYTNSTYPTSSAPELREAGYLALASKPLPQVDGIRVDWTKTEKEALELFRSGKADLIDLHPSFAEEVLEADKPWILKSEWSAKGVKLEKGWRPTFSFAMLNLKTISKTAERRAILKQLDSSFWAEIPGFLESSLPNAQTPSFPRLDNWLDNGISPSAGSPAKKKAQAESSGYSKSLLRKLQVEVIGSDVQARRILESAQLRLEKAGYSVESQNSDLKLAIERFKKGKIDILIAGWNWEVPTWRNVLDPIFFLQHEDVQEQPALARLAALCLDHAKNSAKKSEQIHAQLENLAIWSPGPRHHRHVLVQPWVFGFHVSSSAEHPEKYLRVDRELRKNYLDHKSKR